MLYIVGTPIGNLGDMTIRAIETLKAVDVIACEDTRNSKKLLSHFEIDKPLIAYHKFNERTSAEGIIKLLDEKKEDKQTCRYSIGAPPVLAKRQRLRDFIHLNGCDRKYMGQRCFADCDVHDDPYG